MKLQSLVLIATMISSSAFASIKYNCGNEYGAGVTLTISKSAAGSFYSHTANFTAPAQDPTTGTLIRSKTFSLEGSRADTKGVVYQMHDTSNARHQVWAEVKSVGKKVKVLELILSQDLNSTVSKKVRTCTVTENK